MFCPVWHIEQMESCGNGHQETSRLELGTLEMCFRTLSVKNLVNQNFSENARTIPYPLVHASCLTLNFRDFQVSFSPAHFPNSFTAESMGLDGQVLCHQGLCGSLRKTAAKDAPILARLAAENGELIFGYVWCIMDYCGVLNCVFVFCVCLETMPDCPVHFFHGSLLRVHRKEPRERTLCYNYGFYMLLRFLMFFVSSFSNHQFFSVIVCHIDLA